MYYHDQHVLLFAPRNRPKRKNFDKFSEDIKLTDPNLEGVS